LTGKEMVSGNQKFEELVGRGKITMKRSEGSVFSFKLSEGSRNQWFEKLGNHITFLYM